MNLAPLFLVVAIQAGFIMAPGADFALILRTTAKKGRAAALATAFGMGSGCFILLVLAIFGLNSLLAAAPVLNTIIRYLGALWLIWQAVISFLPHLRNEEHNTQRTGPFLLGFMNHALNIEVVLFYVAVVSQLGAYHISRGIELVAADEMALFTMLWFSFLSFVTGKIPQNERILNHLVVRIIIGGLFLISAIGLIKI